MDTIGRPDQASALLRDLPDLTHDARTSIRTAQLLATDILLDSTYEAWSHFIGGVNSRLRGKAVIRSERVSALKSAQRAYRNAAIHAYTLLFDVVAAEYLAVDADPEAYSERLERVVAPLVRRALPVPHDHPLISAAIKTRVIHWEEQRIAPSGTPGRLAAVSGRETPAQIIERLRRKKGWTMESLAAQAELDIKQVYKVKRGYPVRTDTIGKLAAALQCPPGELIPSLLPPRARVTSPVP